MTEQKGKRFRTPDMGSKPSQVNTTTTRKPRFKSAQEQGAPSAQRVNTQQTIPEVVTSDQPFVVSPEVSGALPKLDAGEGAVITNRSNAASTTGSFPPIDPQQLKAVRRANSRSSVQTQKRSIKKTIALIIGLLFVFVGIMFVMFSSPSEESTKSVQVPEQRVKVAQDGEVEYRDFIFSLSEANGKWELIGRPKTGDGEVRKYLTFEGVPVSLILFEGGFIIPENLPNNKWDVVTYTVSDGSVVSKLMDSSNKPVTGDGKVTKAEVSGNTLTLDFESGTHKSINLK